MGSVGLHVAEYNIGLARAPFESELLADFVAQLDAINAIAEVSPGFVWREQNLDGEMIVTRSVWESIDDLADFVYRNGHAELLRRRRKWFQRIDPHLVLWWIPVGEVPSIAEAEDRLAYLSEHRATIRAFTFKGRVLPNTMMA